MKKYFKVSFLLVTIILFCTACQGDVTRALRHEGFSVGNKFECEAFFGEEPAERIRYLTGSKIITENGSIYEVSLGQKYSNDANCKVANTNLKVVSLFDNKIFRATDGKLYTLNDENNSPAYSEVTSADNSYAIYQLVLQDGVIKAMTADSNNGIYYVLKSDGNVYGVTISKGDRDTQPSIAGSVVVYSSADYGGTITDFGYYGDSASTYVRTTSKVFRMKATNYDECSKFADIPCNYSMMESEFFNKYGEYVLTYNGSMIITTYQTMFSIGG